MLGMRNVAGALVAAVFAMPIGFIAVPAGAAAGTRCKTMSGTATLSPPLPKLAVTKKVVTTIAVKGAKIAGCAGGGVLTGTAAFTARFSKPGNCATLGTAAPNTARGKAVVNWDTGRASTIAGITITSVSQKPTSLKLGGRVSAGVFKGSKIAGTLVYSPRSGGCTKTALSKVTFKLGTLLTIK